MSDDHSPAWRLVVIYTLVILAVGTGANKVIAETKKSALGADQTTSFAGQWRSDRIWITIDDGQDRSVTGRYGRPNESPVGVLIGTVQGGKLHLKYQSSKETGNMEIQRSSDSRATLKWRKSGTNNNVWDGKLAVSLYRAKNLSAVATGATKEPAETVIGSSTQTDYQTATSKFVNLLSETDLSNWRGIRRDGADEIEIVQSGADESMREHWKLEEGVLSYDGPSRGINICTNADYANFELKVDWKVEPGGDSGIYLRGYPQVQIWDTQATSLQSFGAERGSGGLWNNKSNSQTPLVNADKPAGSWNRFHITVVSDRVTVKLNDKLIVDNVILENYWNRNRSISSRGPIEFQSHSGKVSFRNAFLKTLDPTPDLAGAAPPTKTTTQRSSVVRRNYPPARNRVPNRRSNYSSQGAQFGAISDYYRQQAQQSRARAQALRAQAESDANYELHRFQRDYRRR